MELDDCALGHVSKSVHTSPGTAVDGSTIVIVLDPADEMVCRMCARIDMN